MRLWRLGSGQFPLWSGEGARLRGGRWNMKGSPAIYAAVSFSTGVLEVMVHANIGRVPRGVHFITIDIPDDVAVETVMPAAVPEWDAHPAQASVVFGERWLRGKTALVLLVPSVVTGGLDQNALINPLHGDFARVAVGQEAPVRLDPRLFPLPG